MVYLGLGKTLFNSSACLIHEETGGPDIEIALSERLTRKKASGAWPERAIKTFNSRIERTHLLIAENRDGITPYEQEKLLDSVFPFFNYLISNDLSLYSSRFNPNIEFISHHWCHAMAAMAMSPFEKTVILVMDGAGSRSIDFPSTSQEISDYPPSINESKRRAHEECSVYLLEQNKLTCIYKAWQHFEKSERHPRHHFSDGTGTIYEKSAELIFNCKRSAGKVMGLAPFGRASKIESGRQFLENLDWKLVFSGKGKQWDSSSNIPFYSNVAATVQRMLEERTINILTTIKKRFNDYDNLILTGGCALNCTNNMKIVDSGLFREVYIPPFPGDECISLGAASHLYYNKSSHLRASLPHDRQHGYFGPRSSVPTERTIKETFRDFEIIKPNSIIHHAADLLVNDKIIAWFQGRSESGPRALGNRSILARPDRLGLRDYLNNQIKFRETFRPYGCSCLYEKANEYFEVPMGFNNPYMSFAVKTRKPYQGALREVTHIDGTSRMQTVRRSQNAIFYDLIHDFGRRTGLFCLLNTSLNIMGEPIIETVEDARNFLIHTSVYGICLGEFFIRRRP